LGSKKAGFWAKMKPRQQIMTVVMSVVAVLVAAFAVWLGLNLQPLDSSDNTTVKIEIRSGASIEEAAAILGGKQLIRSNLAYIIFSRLTFSSLAAGTHSIGPSMSVPEIVSELSSSGKSTYSITILPETNLIALREILKRYDFSDEQITTALHKQYSHPLLASKPTDVDLEGYIFPDTYEMHDTDSLEQLFEKAFDNLYNKLSTDGSLALMRSRELNIHELLTLASIVGKEVPTEPDQKMVAGVFWNRIDADMPLGSDPTFKYAYEMGLCEQNSPSCDSIWNTRIHTGLPPGPIANMKYSTIQAVLKPTSSNYYYFVSGDDGTTHFSSTAQEHQQNIDSYCTTLCQ